MESSMITLSRYRLSTAKENLQTAVNNCKMGDYKSSINRSYYAIFHSLRAVTAMDRFDSRKHSGIIAFFNRTYVKEHIFPGNTSALIDSAFRLREKADYTDFFIVAKEDAEAQIDTAEKIISMIESYLEDRWLRESAE